MTATLTLLAPGRGGHTGDPPGSAVVVVDFLRFDARPKLADVLRGQTDRPVFRLDPVGDLARRREQAPGPVSLAELARSYADLIREQAGTPAAVAGYCNAASLAVLVTALLTGDGRGPELILVDPTWPTPDRVRAEFGALRHSLGGHGPGAADTGAGLTLDAMLGVLRADLAAMLRDTEDDEEEAELMTEALMPRYRAWLGLLLASESARVPPPAAGLRVIGAGEPALPPGWRLPAGASTALDLHPDVLLAPGSPALELLRAATS